VPRLRSAAVTEGGSDGEVVLVRAGLPSSLTATAVRLRAGSGPHLTRTARRWHVRLELVLVVRRDERGCAWSHPALSRRRVPARW